MTKLIEITNDSGYISSAFPSGFEAVQFPALVRAIPVTYGEHDQYVVEGAYHVPNAELVRIGYTGPLIKSGGLHFSVGLGTAREVNPFTYWNQLKASRPVGRIGERLPVPRPVNLMPAPQNDVPF